MERLISIRLAIAAIGIVTWATGFARDSADVRLAGIVILAVSLALRFARPKRPAPTDTPGR